MACECLIRGKYKNNLHPQGSKAGDVVVFEDVGWNWGDKERYPRYIRIRITDADKEEMRELYTNSYHTELDVNIKKDDKVKDERDIELVNLAENSQGEGIADADEIKLVLDYMSISQTSKGKRSTAKIKFKDLLESDWYWKFHNKNKTITTTYNKTTDEYEIKIKSPYNVNSAVMLNDFVDKKSKVKNKVGDLVDTDYELTFNASREDVFEEAVDHIKRNTKFPVRKKRYQVVDADLDVMIDNASNSVTMEMTKAEFISKLFDKRS